jgi:hypothetical protein
VKTIPVVAAGEDALWGAGAGRPAAPATGPWAAGWGNRSLWDKGEDYPDVLQEVQIPIASDTACASKTDPGMGGFEGGFVVAQYLCGGVPDSDADPNNGSTASDTCSGDSGGPLVAGDGASTWRLVGLVSYGGKCGATNYTAYTKLASYRSWIASIPAAGGGPGGIQAVPSVRVSARTQTSATLVWGRSRGARSYAVYVDIGEGGMLRWGTTAKRSVVLRGLRRGARYAFYVGARSAMGDLSPLRRVVVATRR